MKYETAERLKSGYYFKILLAGKKIRVDCLNRHVFFLCRDYLSEFENPDFSVQTSQEEIQSEVYKVYKTGLFTERLNEEDIATEYIDVESSIVQRKIADIMMGYNILLIHGAAIRVENKCFVFIAPSGTGKTTHVKNWLACIPNTVVINGDKPFLDAEKKIVYGSPWCGKEGMNLNTSAPLEGLIILERGEQNTIRKIEFREMLMTLLRQTYIPENNRNSLIAYQLLGLLKEVPCYRLSCNMNKDSAIVAFHGLCGQL